MVLLGLGAGAFLVAQRPSFWIEFGLRLGNPSYVWYTFKDGKYTEADIK